MDRRTPSTRRSWILQGAIVAAMIAIAFVLAKTVAHNMVHRGMAIDVGFLASMARFPIAQSVLDYAPTDTFAWAFVVGLGNTLTLTVSIIVASTLVGTPLALARRSGHVLARGLASGCVDIARNTPLVVQLLFWYGIVTVSLPRPQEAWQPLSGIFLTGRGVYFTTLGITGTALPLALTIALGLVLTVILAWRGRLHQASLASLITVLVAGALWLVLGLGLKPDVPQLGRYGLVGGFSFTPEFCAVMLGSVLYASAFSAEIIRSGIDAVPAGQWAASRAMGLTERQCLRFVIVPQALRIMLPAMGNHFIAILKNSTLALVVGFPEFSFIANTTMNHTGHALECVLVLIFAYLTMAAAISAAMRLLDAHSSRWAR